MENYQDIILAGSDGKSYALSDFKGKKMVLYFYPKDNTPGCTTQAEEYSQLKEDFEKYNTIIVGVSKDSIESHLKFIEKRNLTILLLSDPEEKLCNAFDVIKEKNVYGKKVLGVVRSSFILNENTNIIESYYKVKANGNALAMLDRIKELSNEK